jgi:fatty-acyl-CoA synthase
MTEASSSASSVATRVRFIDIVRGYIRRGAPRTGVTIKGIVRLARTKPESFDSIGLQVQRLALKAPERVAVRDARQALSYFGFNQLANRWAGWLREQGVGKGVSVALLMENRVELLAAVTAVVKLGGVAGLLNHQQRGEVLAHSLGLIKPRVLIVGSECREALASVDRAVLDGLGDRIAWIADGDDALPDGSRDLVRLAADHPAVDPPETADIQARDPAFYIFTSGTTGMPKAAVMSHSRWLRAMAGVGMASLRMKADDVFYCPLPLYHNNALTLSWGAALSAGAQLYIGRKFSASGFWDEVRASDATVFCYIGELLRYLLAQPVRDNDGEHRLRVCIGNGLRPELWREFQTRFAIPHINEFYGASEGNLVFTNVFNVEGTCGFCPLSFAVVNFDTDAEEAIRDASGRMSKVGAGETGLLIAEITDRAPYDGYTDARASNSKLLRDVFAKGDCWFNTGDLVRNMGLRHIQFVDRVGDTFRWKGENVATTEVERAFVGIDGIAETVVYGVEVPGADGRAGMAVLRMDDPDTFDGAAVARHLMAELPHYAVPLFLRLTREIETTGTHKHRKVDLKRAGFDPAQVGNDRLFALCDRSTGYQPLGRETFDAISNRALRF